MTFKAMLSAVQACHSTMGPRAVSGDLEAAVKAPGSAVYMLRVGRDVSGGSSQKGASMRGFGFGLS
ncbi:hypothetical protein [Bradyrhizobium macuxiense]|uniref:hypothetical protein n=1 Tax=Bradyrhizobium macuxiense TaxID=1755647 RepID=UPI0010A956B3|nr:hypothetical protein [Bradyrhizobium macuxiense]